MGLDGGQLDWFLYRRSGLGPMDAGFQAFRRAIWPWCSRAQLRSQRRRRVGDCVYVRVMGARLIPWQHDSVPYARQGSPS